MADRHLEEEIRRTMLEVSRSCRALVGRCRAVQTLANEAEQLGPLSRYAATVGSHLEAALTTISLMSGGKLSLDRVASGATGLSDRVVLRCVSNVMGRLDAQTQAGPSAPKSERPALQGDNRLVSIPQVLEFLGWLRRTGTLEVTSLAETFKIALEDGQVVHAESDCAPEGQLLGDLLVAQAALAPSDLATFLKSDANHQKRLGAALVESGQITRGQLEVALVAQIRRLFLRLFGAQSATYAFHDASPDDLLHRVRLNTPALLLQSAVHTSANPPPVPGPTADAA